jgi:hypothetical protein
LHAHVQTGNYPRFHFAEGQTFRKLGAQGLRPKSMELQAKAAVGARFLPIKGDFLAPHQVPSNKTSSLVERNVMDPTILNRIESPSLWNRETDQPAASRQGNKASR